MFLPFYWLFCILYYEDDLRAIPDIHSMLGDPEYSELAIAFGRTLRRLRRGADLTQETLAFEANLQRNYISMLELGRNQPTITTLFKLASVLNITPEEMISIVKSELKVGTTII